VSESSTETIRCGLIDVPHNNSHWITQRNRHPTTKGNDWGWISGAPGNICWSNDDDVFNSKKANLACKEHNEWLDRQTSIYERISECRERVYRATRSVEEHQELGPRLQASLDAARNELDRLTAIANALGEES
jgi:hypothetical protein